MMAFAAQNKKAINPVVLDMHGRSGIADYFVIVSGKTETQVRAIEQEIERVCMEEGFRIVHAEGLGQWSWVLVDLGDVIVHVFLDEQRRYYNLEGLWADCPKVRVPAL